MEHYCRVCGKCFPCGRSLGGHMRSHLSLIPSSSSSSASALAKKTMSRACCSNGGTSSNTNSSSSSSSSSSRTTFMDLRTTTCYPLRRNPKLSCRLSEPSVPRRAATKRRSRRVASIATSSSSPAASELDDDEDVAISLMMLSRDSPSARNSALKHGAGVDPKGSDEKRSRFQCPECNKPFRSYQALGGHRANRKRINGGCCTSNIHFPDADAANNSFEFAEKARHRAHQCPICDKVFGSGQALGGHKRSHLMARSADRRMPRIGSALISDVSFAAENKSSSTMHELLDLNLPVAAAADDDVHECKSWWIEGEQAQAGELSGIYLKLRKTRPNLQACQLQPDCFCPPKKPPPAES